MGKDARSTVKPSMPSTAKPAQSPASARTPATTHRPEVTSPKAAAAAASVLRDPTASPAAKTAAASALTQVSEPTVTVRSVGAADIEALSIENVLLKAEIERLTAELAEANRRADEQAEWARRQKV